MKKDNMMMILCVIIVIVIMLGSSIAIRSSSGVKTPYTVIESQSMQHSNESEIGVIDTGDMILVRSLEKNGVTTYMEGYVSDYKTFGDYGSVIIYKRTGQNPVIHRAILWLDWNGENWDAPTLENYKNEDGPLWSVTSGTSCLGMSGTLSIQFKSDYRNITISINLDTLNHHSGYLTLGDNNSSFDQNDKVSISPKELIKEERIKSVAWKEIPWIGAIKLIYKGKLNTVNSLVPNTIPCLISVTITFFLILISLGFVFDYIHIKKQKKQT